MRSNLTKSELHAAAMLLGMWYDDGDHTFNQDLPNGDWAVAYCPETMAAVYHVDEDTATEVQKNELNIRRQRVRDGEIGAADYLPQEVTDGIQNP